jgi:hypothetical protein
MTSTGRSNFNHVISVLNLQGTPATALYEHMILCTLPPCTAARKLGQKYSTWVFIGCETLNREQTNKQTRPNFTRTLPGPARKRSHRNSSAR